MASWSKNSTAKVIRAQGIRESLPVPEVNIAYLDSSGHRVAVVHQYLRKDGTLGGSGRPDPKKLFHDGKLYVLR